MRDTVTKNEWLDQFLRYLILFVADDTAMEPAATVIYRAAGTWLIGTIEMINIHHVYKGLTAEQFRVERHTH
jgi:hypothetical protein